MVRIDKYHLCLAFAVLLSAIEAAAMYDGLKAYPYSYIAFGVAIALIQPFTASLAHGRHTLAALGVSALLMFAVILVSAQRTGGAMDQISAGRAQDARASGLADATATAVGTAMELASDHAKAVCKTNAKGRRCADANAAVTELLKTSKTASVSVTSAPAAIVDNNPARLSAATGGWLSERQVSLFWPFVLPLIAAIAGSYLYHRWGADRAKRRRAPKVGRPVLRVLPEVVVPGGPRDRVELADVYKAYAQACRRSGEPRATGRDFGSQAALFADKAGVQVLESGGRVYWCGVKLAS